MTIKKYQKMFDFINNQRNADQEKKSPHLSLRGKPARTSLSPMLVMT